MKTVDVPTLVVPTQGQGGDERLYFQPGPCQCGDIEDGVSLGLGTPRGWWVISFASLEKLYLEAKKVRKKRRLP